MFLHYVATMSIELILLMRCPDRPGILTRASRAVSERGGDIRDAVSFGDDVSKTFFIRLHVVVPGDEEVASLRVELEAMANDMALEWELHDLSYRPRILLAVSKPDHCLLDLLHRWKRGTLRVDIPAVVSNHDDHRGIVEWYGIPYFHFPADKEDKRRQETKILELVNEQQIDLVVLARYMQILSPWLCEQLSGRCINIHHSFLPSFKGAKPYHQAHDRGVKIIGATAHYVTTDLDEGPIIEQDVRRVSHATSAAQMVTMGREVEASVLARAVHAHVEYRVQMNGVRTVVF